MALLPKETLQPPPLIKLSLESLKSKISLLYWFMQKKFQTDLADFLRKKIIHSEN